MRSTGTLVKGGGNFVNLQVVGRGNSPPIKETLMGVNYFMFVLPFKVNQ